MRTNGFALFRGEGAAARARDAERRVSRYATEVVVVPAVGFGEKDGTGASREKEVFLAYSLEKGGLPLVHGYAPESKDAPAPARGEYAILWRGKSGIYGARDPLGTRGLWVVSRGRGTGSIASDYRILGDGARLIPSGTVFGKGTASKVAKGKKGERPSSFEKAAGDLAALLERSVRERIRGNARVAVSFSGGLDSSLLALLASRHAQVVLCSAYAPGSRDERQSERAASLLGLELETSVLDEKGMREMSGKAELPPGEASLMDSALWCIYSTTSQLASKKGARLIVLGQLADELFGGYMKYSLKAAERGAAAAERMMREDVRACAARGFLRDEAACSASCEVRFPYADASIASFAAGLPFDYKVRAGERKAVLRAAAVELGLPEELASAPKKAAQFSSGAAKLLKTR